MTEAFLFARRCTSECRTKQFGNPEIVCTLLRASCYCTKTKKCPIKADIALETPLYPVKHVCCMRYPRKQRYICRSFLMHKLQAIFRSVIAAMFRCEASCNMRQGSKRFTAILQFQTCSQKKPCTWMTLEAVSTLLVSLFRASCTPANHGDNAAASRMLLASTSAVSIS